MEINNLFNAWLQLMESLKQSTVKTDLLQKVLF